MSLVVSSITFLIHFVLVCAWIVGSAQSARATATPGSSGTPTQTPTPTSRCPKRLLAYYPYWNSGYRADKIPYEKLTHIAHAFVQPKPDGSLEVPTGPPPYFEPNLIINAHTHGARVLVSIGGASAPGSPPDSTFRTIAADPTLRAAFAGSIEAFCRTYGYDGVDIDWEFPGALDPGSPGATDRANFNLMIQAIRNKFDSSPDPAPGWLITAAIPGSSWYGQWLDYLTLNGYIDFYNLMAYDMHGGWGNHMGHNAALYQGADPYCSNSVESYVDYTAETRAVPLAKLNLGVPFFGYKFTTVENLFDTCSPCSTTYLNYQSVLAYLGSGWTSHWDSQSGVPYLTRNSGAGVLTYDNPASVGLKVDYALAGRGLGGVFMWDLSADYQSGTGQPLMEAMYNAYSTYCFGGTPTPTPVGTPVCGNGIVEAEESCDDGNTQDGDCCRATCEWPTGCRPFTRASLRLLNSEATQKRQVRFAWRGASGFPDFGDPTVGTQYRVCIQDATHSVVTMFVPAAASCGDYACWTVRSGKDVRYRDWRFPPVNDGVTVIQGQADDGAVGRARLTTKARGERLPTMHMNAPLAAPVKAHVITSDAACWEAEFQQVDATRNDGTEYRARARIAP